jgi:hypothetical protein
MLFLSLLVVVFWLNVLSTQTSSGKLEKLLSKIPTDTLVAIHCLDNSTYFGAVNDRRLSTMRQIIEGESELGPPTPSPASECCSPLFGSKGETHLVGGGGPNSNEGTDNLVLHVYCILYY